MIRRILLIATIGMLPLIVSAEDIKFGVVDMEQLFRDYYKTKIANGRLKKQAETYKEYSDKLASSQLQLTEEFKALRDASQNIAFTATQRESKRLAAQDKYRQLKAKEVEFEQYGREKRIQLRDQEAKMRQDILTEIRKTIAKYAKANKFTIVIDSSGKTQNNISAVIYYKTEIDITDIILKIINKGAEK
jgi:Skp family chaperone for outer membrane proteins